MGRIMSTAPTKMGEMLKRARLARGWSRAEFSRRAGISANTIAKYEKAGEPSGQYPSMPRLAAIAAIFELDARVLLAACAEDQTTAKKLLVTDSVQYKGTDKSFGLALLLRGIFSKDEPIKDSDFHQKNESEELAEYAQQIEEAASNLGLSLYSNPEIDPIIQSKAKKSPEDDLPSPPSSNPNQTSLTKKEKDRG
jgi:transcriptional regulator with XRE-family HTH domain